MNIALITGAHGLIGSESVAFFSEKMDRFGSHHKFALWSQTLVFFKPAY